MTQAQKETGAPLKLPRIDDLRKVYFLFQVTIKENLFGKSGVKYQELIIEKLYSYLI